jgi:transposase
MRLGPTPGEAHENRFCRVFLTALHRRTMLLADRGYDGEWIRALSASRVRGPTYPEAKPQRAPLLQSPSPAGVWPKVSSIKSDQCGRLGTRCAKLAANYLTFTKLAPLSPPDKGKCRN